jgi:hypothetical protein
VPAHESFERAHACGGEVRRQHATHGSVVRGVGVGERALPALGLAEGETRGLVRLDRDAVAVDERVGPADHVDDVVVARHDEEPREVPALVEPHRFLTPQMREERVRRPVDEGGGIAQVGRVHRRRR